jgi:hypothetical protein
MNASAHPCGWARGGAELGWAALRRSRGGVVARRICPCLWCRRRRNADRVASARANMSICPPPNDSSPRFSRCLWKSAEADIVEAADWYDRRSIGLGDELMAEVEAALASILDRPATWPLWPGLSGLRPPVQPRGGEPSGTERPGTLRIRTGESPIEKVAKPTGTSWPVP